MKLPKAVLDLIGPEVTPARVAESFEAWASESHPDAHVDREEAEAAYHEALAAAAIRECETFRRRSINATLKAMAAYDRLRKRSWSQ